jgi:hypothetical protein
MPLVTRCRASIGTGLVVLCRLRPCSALETATGMHEGDAETASL